MKTQLLCLIIFLSVRIAEAQPITNSGFESWSNNSLGRLDVDGWGTSNLQYSAATVVQDIPHTGNYSAKMVSIYDAGAGSYVGGDLAIAETYASAYAQPGSLKGYFKQNVLDLFDHIYVMVVIYDSLGNNIGTGSFNPPPLTNYSTFTLFNAPISYTSGANMWGYSIFISFFPSTQSNAVWAVVDDVYFDATSDIEEAAGLEQLISVFPNPVLNQITIESQGMQIQGIEIYNMIGEKIISLSSERFSVLSKKSTLIDVSDLQSGIYLVEVKMENGAVKRKFIKE